jgi:hypothetical protein
MWWELLATDSEHLPVFGSLNVATKDWNRMQVVPTCPRCLHSLGGWKLVAATRLNTALYSIGRLHNVSRIVVRGAGSLSYFIYHINV